MNEKIINDIICHAEEWKKTFILETLRVSKLDCFTENDSLIEIFRKYGDLIPIETFRLDNFDMPEFDGDFEEEINFLENIPGFKLAHHLGDVLAMLLFQNILTVDNNIKLYLIQQPSLSVRVLLYMRSTYPVIEVWLENDILDLPFEMSVFPRPVGVIMVRLVKSFSNQELLVPYPVETAKTVDFDLVTEKLEQIIQYYEQK